MLKEIAMDLLAVNPRQQGLYGRFLRRELLLLDGVTVSVAKIWRKVQKAISYIDKYD